MNDQGYTTLHIGIDDTDSLKGSCTTYIAANLVEKIALEVEFIDFPRLIRNNPNIPWKTRGNGSVCISFKLGRKKIDDIISITEETINELFSPSDNTNPGMAIIEGAVPPAMKDFAIKALVDIVSISEAESLAEKYSYHFFTLGNGRGLIGALAAIGNTLTPTQEDYTYELLAYRRRENWGKRRLIDEKSVKQMDRLLTPNVFNNVDEFSGKILITPAGKDPVLYGIRGESPKTVLEAHKLVKKLEPIERYCIFRTNQGTDQHFIHASSAIKDYSVFKGIVEITDLPKVLVGGHVIVKGRITKTNEIIDVAAFEPTKRFRHILRELIPGDIIEAYGGIYYSEKSARHTLHLEKYRVTHLVEKIQEHAPLCPRCGKRMESAGRNKGYKCKKCGFKDRSLTKTKTVVDRKIPTDLLIPPGQAQRHLVKPYRRYGLEKTNPQNRKENELKLLKTIDWWKRY